MEPPTYENVPHVLREYLEKKRIPKLFADLIQHTAREMVPTPQTEGELRVALMKYCIQRVDAKQLESIGVRLHEKIAEPPAQIKRKKLATRHVFAQNRNLSELSCFRKRIFFAIFFFVMAIISF